MCKTIKQKVKIQASPDAVYEILTNSKRHSALTGKPAKLSLQVGGTFTTAGANVSGVNVDLKPRVRIVQAWRRRDFPEGVFSMVSFVFLPTRSGGTDLVLTHRGVPKEMIPDIETFWREEYWHKMRIHFKGLSGKKSSQK